MNRIPTTQFGEMRPDFGQKTGEGEMAASPQTKAALGAVAVEAAGDKVWLDRAKEVIRETKNDPNKRLTEVALLREEYMRKRYNRILGEGNE